MGPDSGLKTGWSKNEGTSVLKTGLSKLKEPVVFKTGLSEMKNLTNLWTCPVPTLYADLNCNFFLFRKSASQG